MRHGWMAMATLAMALGSLEAAAACLRYGPPVQLTGSLNQKPLPGADRQATYWFIRLEQPACVEARPGSGVDVAMSTVREVQLVLPGEFHARYQSLLGTRVTGVGTLSGASTAHHRAPLVMSVQDLRRADAR